MNARDYALAQIDRAALPGWPANLLRRRASPPDDPRDIALAEQIRTGVIKNHALLDFLVDHFATNPRRIDPLIRKVLAIALYQLRFLSRIPASAAVDEAVEQARRVGRPHAAGFVNAMLRSATREINVPLPKLSDDPARYAQIVLSHPQPLFDRFASLFGTETAVGICEHNNREPPVLVRTFRGGLSRLPLADPSNSPDADVPCISAHEQPGIRVVHNGRRSHFAEWAENGIAQVQDATAARVAEQLDLQPGQDVLDRCAGLGTKTLQMHDLLQGSGWILAIDPSEPRCQGLRRLIEKREIGNIAVVQASMLRDIPDLKRPAFDRILVDAPCSNSGVLARRPEARYAQSPDALRSLEKLQDQIMDDTAAYLRPGGLLLYSTCSIWPEENEQRVARFIEAHRDYEQLHAHFTLPSLDADPAKYRDGGYFAILRRRD